MRRALLFLSLLVPIAAGVTAYVLVSREQEYQRLVAQGTRALGADRTFEAVEAFSYAIQVRGDKPLVLLLP